MLSCTDRNHAALHVSWSQSIPGHFKADGLGSLIKGKKFASFSINMPQLRRCFCAFPLMACWRQEKTKGSSGKEGT